MTDPHRHIENLQRILEITRYLAVVSDLDVLLGAVVESAADVLDCDRATIFLFDPAENQLYSRIALGVEGIRFPADRGIAGAAAQSRGIVNVPDAYADARFNQEVDRRTGYRTRNLLAIPMENLNGELIGVLQALNKKGAAFGPEDEQLAQALAAQAGVAIERARLLEIFAEKQRMQRDLDLAREIQQALFPERDPQVSGFDIAGWNQPADETGGDCYDFVPLADGRLAILLADATGHGIGAALVIAQARSVIRAMLAITDDLSRIATATNELLCADLSQDRFVTAFIGILDPAAGTLRYISCGQGPLLMIRGDAVEMRGASDLPLAVAPGLEYDCVDEFTFSSDGIVALLTDGFFEAAAPGGELFGITRISDLLRAPRDCSAHESIERLYEAVCTFVAEARQADDLTAVVVRRCQ